MTESTKAAPALRRIAVRDADRRHDLVIPLGQTLAHALSVFGSDPVSGGRVFGPGGEEVAVRTPVADLREGGLYTIARERPVSARERRLAAVPDGFTRVGPWWVLLGCSILVGIISTGLDRFRLTGALLLGIGAILGVFIAQLRPEHGERGGLGISFYTPVALAVIAALIGVPQTFAGSAQLAIAAAAAAAALICALTMVINTDTPRRAAASALVVVFAGLAVLWGLSILAGYGVSQAALVTLGFIPLLLRALPSALFTVDEGYQIDFGRFMTARWTVRGKVPEYRPTVEVPEVEGVVAEALARLRALTLVFSIIAALCFPAIAEPLLSDAAIQRWAALALLAFLPLSLLLGGRRVSGAAQRTPPRIAVMVGIILVSVPVMARLTGMIELGVAVGLLVGALLAAAVIVPFSRNVRSLGWSRTGDIVESFALAFSPVAALLAAGTLTLLQGALS
ncbi:hypothetical protein [Mycetocola saprophilus]|uniref:hypothetical protein n=1 Tax=Mycetocola saprophilus TaxID=76636 RepID=UPI003BF055C4